MGWNYVRLMPSVRGFFLGDSRSLLLVIILKSKYWFMERLAMKMVQP
jgi:hypothetical protein